MKRLLLALMCGAALLTGSNALSATEYHDYEFNQERMIVTQSVVYVASSFDGMDYITCYDHYGARLWNTAFASKIVSWKIQDDMLFVFSKAHTGHKTFLTCLNRWSGLAYWERP